MKRWIERLIYQEGRCAPNGIGRGIEARRNRITGKVQMLLSNGNYTTFHKFHWRHFRKDG